MEEGLRRKTVSGVKWNSVGTLTTTALHMIKLFILARILTDTDFGLLAIATMVLGFVEIFANMGLATGLIHKQEVSREQYSSVFWLNLLLSAVLYVLLWASTPFIARYYHQPLLLKVIPLLSLTLVINSFGKMFYTFKTKELDFKFISLVQIVGVLLGVVFTIILALNGLGVFSLVYGALLQALLTQGVYALSGIRKYRILFHFRISEIVDIIKIGGYQLGMQVLDYISTKLDVFLIGRFFGMEILGIYNLSKELLYKVVQLITPIVTNVAAPAFARFQDDKPQMRISYGRILNLLSFVNFPIFAVLALFAEPIVALCYGEKMMEMVWFVRVLSLWGLFQSIGTPAGILMVSLGRTDLGFRWTLVRVVTMFIATYIACHISIFAMAWTQVLLAFIFLFAYWRMMVFAMIKLPLRPYLSSVSFPLMATVVAALPVLPLFFFSSTLEAPIRIAVLWLLLVLYIVCYFIFYFLVNRTFLKELLTYIKH